MDDPAALARFGVLQITPRLEAGGVEETTVDLALALARLGHRSLVASAGGALEQRLAAGGVRLLRLPVQSRNPLTILANGAALAREHRVSVLHARSRAPAFSALIAGALTGRPVVATYHGVYSAGGSIKRWYNAVMTRGDLVIANSAFTRDHILTEHGVDPAKVVLAPEGVDTVRFDPGAVSGERIEAARAAWGLGDGDARLVVLMAARPAAWKGHALLIEALAGAHRREGLLVVLSGAAADPAYAAALRQRALAAGVAASVVIAPPSTDMPAALAAADILAAPSLRAESFGRSVVEAAAMARPVLASAIGAHFETVVDGETGWLAPAGDRAAWSAAIDAAAGASAERRVAMGAAARRRAVDLHGLDAMVAANLAAYRLAIDRRRHR